MKTLSLTVTQQDALLQAHMALDGYDVVQGDKIVRVPYKLGAERRVVAKNINALRKSLDIWNETRKGIVKEHWPDKPEDEEVDKDKDPVGWLKFVADITVASMKQDEIMLLPFSEKVMYDSNEFPVLAIATLDQHGLIE
jgi:hypothetical protein